MSDDLISRQAVLDYIDSMPSELTADGRRMIRRIRLTEYIQDSLPSFELERKKGKWVWVDGVRCSNCNHKLQTTGLPSFCPNCGAEMTERSEDEGGEQN